MRKNYYGTGSVWLPIIMVVLLSGIVGVSIPLMSGGLPRGQGNAQASASPMLSQQLAFREETPPAVVEAAGRSDMTMSIQREATTIPLIQDTPESSTPTVMSVAEAPQPNVSARAAKSVASMAQPDTMPSPTSLVAKPAADSNTYQDTGTNSYLYLYLNSSYGNCDEPKARAQRTTAAIPATATYGDAGVAATRSHRGVSSRAHLSTSRC